MVTCMVRMRIQTQAVIPQLARNMGHRIWITNYRPHNRLPGGFMVYFLEGLVDLWGLQDRAWDLSSSNKVAVKELELTYH